MARRKRGTSEQQARKALISELLSAANVQSMDDIQDLFKETIADSWKEGLKPNSMRSLAMSLTSILTTVVTVTARKS